MCGRQSKNRVVTNNRRFENSTFVESNYYLEEIHHIWIGSEEDVKASLDPVAVFVLPGTHLIGLFVAPMATSKEMFGSKSVDAKVGFSNPLHDTDGGSSSSSGGMNDYE